MSRYYRSFLEESGVAYTARTTAFASATGITDLTILGALNTFDLGLISNSLDTKMKAVYPMVGGTSTTCKYNFMNAVDSNSAFRLQFFGGGTFSSTGYKPNGTNAYSNTFYNATALGDNPNSVHLSYYSRTNSNGAEVEIGCRTGLSALTAYNLLEIRTSGTTYSLINQAGLSSFVDSDSLGFYLGNRPTSNLVNAWKSGVKKVEGTSTSSGNLNTNIYIGAMSNFEIGDPSNYTTKECAFSSIGTSLTDGEATTFYNLVQAMQISLARNV